MWILRAFSTFSKASGLSLNKSKSEIYFNGIDNTTIQSILQVSGFKRGTLPFKYLGIPISSKKLTKNEGLKLTEKIVARIRGWGAKHISFAGRVVLVNSVLNTLHSYWSSIFLIPSYLMNKINSICRNYLWSGTSEYKKCPNISWDICCSPKEEGGLGIKNAKCWNKALLGKYVWWLANKKDHLWVRWVNHVYLKGVEWCDYRPPADCSWSWKKIATIMTVFKQAYTCNKWMNDEKDYTLADGYNWLRIKGPKVNWRFICWNSLNIPKSSFIFWEFQHQRLPTKDRLYRMGITYDLLCPICMQKDETHKHLMYECEYAKECIRLLHQNLGITMRLPDLVAWYSTGRRFSALQKRYVGACHVALTYWIWRIRNEARIEFRVRRPHTIVQ